VEFTCSITTRGEWTVFVVATCIYASYYIPYIYCSHVMPLGDLAALEVNLRDEAPDALSPVGGDPLTSLSAGRVVATHRVSADTRITMNHLCWSHQSSE
jgi:hypothetical protein